MSALWPALDYEDWKNTYETLHRWTQAAGKLRLIKAPWLNHSWHAVYYVSSRGLTTSAIPLEDRNITVEFDLIDHRLRFEDSRGKKHSFQLLNESVAAFYEKFLQGLREMNVELDADPHPCELADNTPFYADKIHRAYNPGQARRFFEVLVLIDNVFQTYRAEYTGKSSPSHFFWGSFDLAVTRFSGRRAPEHPGAAPHLSPLVVKEAYSHEVASCGFWPGNEAFPHAAFYAYAYPEPRGYMQALAGNGRAFYHPELKEWVLPYEDVRNSSDPGKTLLDFLRSSYEAASSLGIWDKEGLEGSPFLKDFQSGYHLDRPSLH